MTTSRAVRPPTSISPNRRPESGSGIIWSPHFALACLAGGTTRPIRDGENVFNNFQFLNMGRSLYDGQRSVSSERVWSINRNFYTGSLRYGYAEWSGDINTGFQTMAYQRKRMIATLNVGEPEWSMDTGGYNGRPTPENYARWMEFGAFVPIFRVHGGSNQKRQPWVYGPVAEEAAKRVMRLRYDLMPYIYSNVRGTTETGIGVVRPLLWEFPEDEKCDEETRGWMFGDALVCVPDRGTRSDGP